MPWPVAKLHPKKLTSYAACWTNTSLTNRKGAGDDRSHELAFPEHDAFAGLDPAPLSVARHGHSGAGCGAHDSLPPCFRPLCAGRGRAGSDARRADRYVLLSYTFWRSGPRGGVFSSRADPAHTREPWRGRDLIRILPLLSVARRSTLAGGSVAARGSVPQPSLRRRIPAPRAGAPQTVEIPKRPLACDLPHPATPPWSGPDDPLLRVPMAAGSGGDWLVPSHRAVARDGSHRTFRGTAAIGDRPRTGAHSAARRFRKCFPGFRRDSALLSPRRMVAE